MVNINKESCRYKFLILIAAILMFFSIFSCAVHCGVSHVLAAETETYAVTYDANGSGMFSNGSTQNVVVYETTATINSGSYQEPVPTSRADRFIGWYTDAACIEGHEFDVQSLAADITVYAKYETMAESYSGTCGGCSWIIYEDGLLRIYPTDEISGTLPSNVYGNGDFWPWYEYRDSINKAVVEDGVVGGSDVGSMFSRCSSLTELDLSGFNMNSVTDMSSMFLGCASLTSLDLSSFDTSNVTSMYMMFSDCTSLTSIDLSSFNTIKVTNMDYMFSDCASLTNLNLSSFDTSNVTSMSSMFSGCQKLANLDLSNFDTNKVKSMRSMFSGCSLLAGEEIQKTIVGFNTGNVTDMGYMFNKCSSLVSLDLSGFNTIKVTDMTNMFYGCSSLTRLNLSGFNTSNITSMYRMFCKCSSLTSLDLSSFNTNKVTDMSELFSNCNRLTNLDISSFDTSNVTTMYQMFYFCSDLTNLDLSNFNTNRTANMNGMFYKCSSLTDLDLSDFNTNNVTNMGQMFYGCSSLTSLDLSNFNTNKTATMSEMFYGCNNLTSLDLSSIDTGSVTNMLEMFYNCNSLSKIHFSDKFNFVNIGYYFNLETDGWIKARNADGRKTYDYTTYTTTQITTLNNTDSTPLLGGMWIRNYNGDDYITNEDGSIEYISVDEYWDTSNDAVWKYAFTVFDDTLVFKLFEEFMENYTSAAMAPYYIEVKNNQAVVENKLTATKYGKLEITKTVEGSPLADDDFEFTIILSGIDVSGTKIFNNVVFENGIGRFTLKANESKTFDLPVGTKYSVSEKQYIQYTSAVTNGEGVVEENVPQKVSVVNTYLETPDPEADRVNLTLKKTVSENCDTSTEFYISGYFTNLEPNTTYAISDGNSFTSNESGIAFYDAVLMHPEEIVFYNLPVGATYQFTEHENKYIGSVSVKDTSDSTAEPKQEITNKEAETAISIKVETLVSGEDILVHFHSDTTPLQDLIIIKNVKEETEDNRLIDYVTDETFEFTIIFSNMAEGTIFSSDVGKIVADEYGEATKTFYLKNGKSVKFYDIPIDVQYTIAESSSDYVASYQIVGTNIVSTTNKNTSKNQTLSTMTETVDANEDGVVVFTNIQPLSVVTTIRKTDNDNELLANAVLQILDVDDNVVAEFTTTNEDYVVNLIPGTYTLHEVSAPRGYLIAEDIEFAVAVGDENIVTMIDKPITVLTSTGGNGTLITVAVAVVLGAIMVACIYIGKKKSKENSEFNDA